MVKHGLFKAAKGSDGCEATNGFIFWCLVLLLLDHVCCKIVVELLLEVHAVCCVILIYVDCAEQ